MMIERGHPLWAATQGPRQVQEKRPVPRRSKHVLFMKKQLNMIERGDPVVCRDASHVQGHEQSMLKEVNIDFRIPGLPHSVVKQAEISRVRELVKKIENHPHRHALQLNLQQNRAYNPVQCDVKEND